MSRLGPDDPQQRAAWRRARVQAARDHHPDVGGDPEAYLLALAHVDARFGVPGRTRCGSRHLDRVPVEVHRPPLARLRRSLRRRLRATRGHVRQLRARLPRRAPAARRYIDL